MEEQKKETETESNFDSNKMLPKSPPKLNEGNKNTLMAVLSYLGILVIIPFLNIKNESSFVKFHVKQGLTLLALWVVIWFLSVVLWQFWLVQILNLLAFILAIIGIVNVLRGHEKNLPVIGQFSKYFTF